MYFRHLQRTATSVAARSQAMIEAEIAFGDAAVSQRGKRGVSVYKGRPMSNTAIGIAKQLAGQTHGGKSYEQSLKDRQSTAGLDALKSYRRPSRSYQ
ncbi:MAG: hypothetical protein QXL94_00095 [Candidatus Parvarchaeum sp.]